MVCPGVRFRKAFSTWGRPSIAFGTALAEPDGSSLVVDGTIQRFEFVIELFWKTLKRLLEYEGVEARTPREALQRAYQAGWLKDEAAWLQMLRDRNETSHLYDEAAARRIYGDIRRYFSELERTFVFLADRYRREASSEP